MTEKIRVLKLIHLAICITVILMYSVRAFVSSPDQLSVREITSTDMLYLVIPIFAYILSNFLYKFQLNQMVWGASLEEKLPVYQTASIIRWAILEGAALVILFLKPDMLVLGIIIILYLAFLKPTIPKANKVLKDNVFDETD